MNCPGCAAPMTTLTLDGHVGTKIAVDLCKTCQVLWFDQLESPRLAPGAVLHLFRVIGERGATSPTSIPDAARCPRCGLRLQVAHDRQRATPFRYRNCTRKHGRLITFFDFLREKDFIRPLSPSQLAELRQNVQMINCSNCGAPIDLAGASACAHCATPISMLDLNQIERMTKSLTGRAAVTVDPMLPVRLEREKHEVDRLFETLKTDGQWKGSSSIGLVELGLQVIAKWLN